MSKKFHAVNRETGDKWVSNARGDQSKYLVMYDSGYLAVVYFDGWYTYITPLNPKKWETIIPD